ncbi:hypothetical protein Y1Q_0004615 [Alligator mississippiensis]|uniref:Uncharacterized protein n=1 Tax=Alligator mississippiensis TaxID=8496 RepID=A0A151MHM9_ALLMI|nr:hypothetical protein Y1Q_0004615 [Alligator mississippiensis]
MVAVCTTRNWSLAGWNHTPAAGQVPASGSPLLEPWKAPWTQRTAVSGEYTMATWYQHGVMWKPCRWNWLLLSCWGTSLVCSLGKG